MSSYHDLTREELIRRLQQAEAIQKQVDERQFILASLGSILALSLDYEATLQRIAQLSVPALADWCSILLLEDNTLRRVATISAFPDPTNAIARLAPRFYSARSDIHVGSALASGETELISDFDEDYLSKLTRDHTHRQAIRDLGTTSLIRVPLVARGRILGLINFNYGHSGRRYTTSDVPMFEELGHSAALAIDNASLFRATQRRLAEVTAIQRVASVVNSSVPLDTIFQKVVETINQVFGYRLISVYLRHHDQLHLQAAIGYEDVFTIIRVDEGISGRVVRTGQAIFVRNADQDPEFLKAIPIVKQCIIVPLKSSNGQVSGTLAIESETESLTDQDMALLLLVADQISVAVTNARLFGALRDSERRYRALVDQAADAILMTDGNWHITDINSQTMQLFDRSYDDLIGAYLPSLCKQEPHPLIWPPQLGSTFHILRKNGNTCPVEASISTLIDQDTFKHIVILRDITERLHAEEVHRMTERRLLEAQRLESLGVLAGGIAHDFNNLLMAIMGNAGLMGLDLPEDSPIQESLTQIELAARRATELTQQMLAYAGKARIAIQPISLTDTVRDITMSLQAVINRNTKIEQHLATQMTLVMADDTQMRQIILSLVTNAAEAIGDQFGTITITTETRWLDRQSLHALNAPRELLEGEYAALIITDSGPGIEPALRQRIFEPFFSTKFTGRGLGLSAVQGMVNAHGGLLTVDSTPGHGATFTIFLPASTALQSGAPSAPLDFAMPITSRGAVLVIDDELAVRTTAARMIRQIQLPVLMAENGQTALQILKNQPEQVTAVLLDLTMPFMSGAEVYSAIQQNYPHLAVILMSGYSAEEVIGRFNTALPPHFLKKPFSLTSLRSTLAQVLTKERV